MSITIRRVRGRRHVLQIVRCVGPTAAHRNELAGARGVIDDDAVARVHDGREERVVAGALLAHVVEQRVGGTGVRVRPNANDGRGDTSGHNRVLTGTPQSRKINAVVHDTRTERLGRGRHTSENLSTARIRYVEGLNFNALKSAENRDLWRTGQIAKLIYPDYCDRWGRGSGLQEQNCGVERIHLAFIYAARC